jgi:hypothetical protein
MVDTNAALFTLHLLRPVALGVIASEGYSNYLTDGGKGKFTCSKKWLASIFREQKWSFRKPQSNSRKLPDNWKPLVHDMLLRVSYFVNRYEIPPQLVINADHTGIMHLQLKGGGWASQSGRGVVSEVQEFG